MKLRIGTRPSALAMAQAGLVAERLRSAGHANEMAAHLRAALEDAAPAGLSFSQPTQANAVKPKGMMMRPETTAAETARMRPHRRASA